MAISYFPFDAGAGSAVTEAEWRKMATHWRETGVIADELNELAVGESTPNALSVDVDTGAAWIRGHYMESDAIVQKAIAAADVTNPRIDRVVLRVDFAGNTISVEVLTGTPAASPSAPALTQSASTWEISLAQVRVNAGASTIIDANITDERRFSLTDGSNLGVVKDYAGSVAPTGYELITGASAGAAVSRTTYADLFALIGTQYGVGDGSTTFNLPDAGGRTVVGLGTHADVNALGDSDGLAVGLRRPKHKHTVTDAGHDHTVNVTDPGHDHTVNVTDPGHSHGVTDAGHSHGITDPGHFHSVDATRIDQESTPVANREAHATGGTNDYNTASATTGISVNSATTGVTVNSGTTGVTADAVSATTGVTADAVAAATGVTVGPQTGSEPTDGPAHLVLNKIIRAR